MPEYGPMSTGPNCPSPAADGDQMSNPGVPGHNSPMHPGFAANKVNHSKRNASKHRAHMRESVPMTPMGTGGASAMEPGGVED